MEFKVDDVVEFELRPNRSFPRWCFDSDEDSSGKWAQGKVVEVNPTSLEVEFITCSHVRWWCWPLKGHPKYSEDQWSRPGYLRHATTVKQKYQCATTCECGAHKTSNPNLHSTWCPLWKEV